MRITAADITRLRFDPTTGLLPAIVQHADTGAVLMLGYMSAVAMGETLARGRVVFWSRSRQQLWEKGESSGHTLQLVDLRADCDADTVLALARPLGPVCHNGTQTCFGDGPFTAAESLAFIIELERVVAQRIATGGDQSYTARLFAQGLRRMAQKVGEEGVEVALAAAASEDDASLIGESADLLFHLTVLLKARGLGLGQVIAELQSRHRQTSRPAT